MEWDSEEAFFLRLAETIRRAGGAKEVSKITRIPLGTLNKYLAATSVPSFTNVQKIARAGEVSLDWLAGSGAAKKRASATKNTAFATVLVMKAVSELIERVYKEESVTLPASALRTEISDRMKALIERIDDAADIEEAMSMLQWLELRIRKDLKQAAAHPGTGKREVS